jgi:NADPH:quinone reductase-like Zn-dependent oxidoreductase
MESVTIQDMRIPIVALLVAIVAAVGAVPAGAHHATTKFDQERVEKISGVVTGFTWKFPHIKIEIGRWLVEMKAPGTMSREGWKRESLSVGDQVTVYANPLRKDDPAAAARLAWYVGIILADGSMLGRVEEVPATSKAVVRNGQDLSLQTVPTPKPSAGQVLIRVYAAGVNPVDWKRDLAIPGYDAAGVVASVGSGVTAFKQGDFVLARAEAAYAQFAVADADLTVLKPKGFTFEQAAGVPIAGIAGYRAVEEAKVSRGQRVAIIGAAGGSGEAAVRVAKTRGAQIIAVGHSSQREFLKSLGVDEFVAFDREDVAAKVRNVDAGLNLVDGQAAAVLGYVKRGGHFTSIMGSPGDDRIAAAGVTAVVVAPATYQGISEGDALRAMMRLADKGQYKVTVTKTFPLAQAQQAQDFVRNGQAIGKTILVVDALNAKQR